MEPSYNYCHHYFCNQDNDFRADIEIRGIAGQDNCTISTYLGLGDLAAVDSMLGDADNEIFFSYVVATYRSGVGVYNRNTIVLNQVGEAGFNRKVHGTGSIAGKKVTTSFSTSDCPLVLGNGFVADPCQRKADVLESIYGTQGISGSSISFKPGATLVVDVDVVSGTPKSDAFIVSTSSAFNLAGTIQVREQSEIATDTVIGFMTVPASAGSCTASIASITPGWGCSVAENPDGGWTVNLVKVSSEPVVQFASVSERGPTEMKVSANVVSLGAVASGDLVFYYGQTDGGSDPSAWDASVVYGTVTDSGTYAAKISGLQLGTYYIRPAVLVNGTSVFASDPASVSTVPESTPSEFIWRRIEDDWDTIGAWERKTLEYARTTPGFPGDQIDFDLWGYYTGNENVYGSNAVVSASHDTTVGVVRVTGGYGHYLKFLPDAGCEFVFDNNEENPLATIGSLATMEFGSADVPAVLRLRRSAKFRREGSYGCSINFFSRITGGTAEAPCCITFEAAGDQWGDMFPRFLNPDNDFIGDIVATRVGSMHLTIYVGSSSVMPQNGMLGNESNKVLLYNGSALSYWGTTSLMPTCERTVVGNGTITGIRYQDRWTSPKNSVALGQNAVVEPCGNGGTGFGTIRIDGTSIADNAGTTYKIDVDADDTTICDRVEFVSTEAFSPLGTFVVYADDPTAKISPGTRWAIGAIDKSAGAVDNLVYKYSGDYRVYAEGDAESGWTIYAEKKAAGLFIIMR